MSASDQAPATADDVFAALASPVRRDLLRLLLGGTRTVNELAAHFDMSRPSVSEHLRVLRDARLVSERKAGRERHYSLEPRPLLELRDWLNPYEKFWRQRMRALRDALEEEP
ncbi:MAG: helix-turn-helix transcriptional regulator [Streptosporangiaceae bacterium]|nr:helix-turn-helix transcriptional regulator [Streptosporangiaceae bacterium]MBV9855472.1 helix-turn-helix transcriptional regulator [Streptosporangiaceae bacterium]